MQGSNQGLDYGPLTTINRSVTGKGENRQAQSTLNKKKKKFQQA